MEEKIYKHPYFGEIYYLADVPEKYKNKAEWQNDTPVFVPGGRKKFEARPPSTQILRP